MAFSPRYPLIEEIKTPVSPLNVFELFGNDPFLYFLDSGMGFDRLGRYSFIGSSPFMTLKSYGRDISLTHGNREQCFQGDPFDTLRDLMNRYRLESVGYPVPFVGGVVGYLSYDLGRLLEKIPEKTINDLGLPDMYLGFYDCGIAFDNLTGTAYIVSTGFPEQNEPRRLERAKQRSRELLDRLNNIHYEISSTPSESPTISPDQNGVISNFIKSDYLKAVERARRYIIDGDIFEVNLSQRFEAPIKVNPHQLYLKLRTINPAPFGCYLGFSEIQIVSASPERFLRKTGDMVETRPIKGTRRRGQTAEEDHSLAAELLASNKDRAENIMIVDLERNDLGRVCRYGSVKVSELAVLETYPTVFHLTSTIEGRLREDKDDIDLIRATFPGGSITGAPKVRSMEIIEELEPTRRSIYTGSIGYIGFNGDIDLNIVIRTFIVKGDRVYFQAGGAVVYDSDPVQEYRETLDKARALFAALGIPVPSDETN
jgi:para-aminobenzoate synthetase component I